MFERLTRTLGGMKIMTLNARCYEEGSGQISEYEFKTTAATTQPTENYIKEFVIDDTAVGWYLVKQAEPFGALVNRIYKNPIGANWETMAANNPHLKNVSSRVTMLQPGQVVIISKQKNGPKLARLKADAQKAQAAWERASKEHKIDHAFLSLLDLKLQGQKFTMEKPEPYHDEHGEMTAVLGIIEMGKPWVDGTIEFHKSIFEQSTEAYRRVEAPSNSCTSQK